MSDLNHLVIQGRITKNANFRLTQSGKKIADFTIATNRARRKADGEYENVGNFFNISTFVSSDNFAKHLVKGQLLTVEGYLKQDRWEQDDGAKRSQNNIGVTRIYLAFPQRKPSDGETETANETTAPEPSSMIFDGETPDEEIFVGEGDIY